MSEPASLGPIEVELPDHRLVRLREMRMYCAGARSASWAWWRRSTRRTGSTSWAARATTSTQTVALRVRDHRDRRLGRGWVGRRLGFSVSSDPDDAMVKIVRLDLTRWTTKKR